MVLGAVLVAISAYLAFLSQFVPPGHPRAITTLGVFCVAGVLAGASFRMHLLGKLGLAALIPIGLVVIEGGDAAKPGLHYLIGLILLGGLWLGVVVGHLAWRWNSRDHA